MAVSFAEFAALAASFADFAAFFASSTACPISVSSFCASSIDLSNAFFAVFIAALARAVSESVCFVMFVFATVS